MLAALTLPALAFLMGISGIPGLNALPGLKKAVRHKPAAAYVDSLPPAWKPASRLAVEHDFLKPGLPPMGGAWPVALMVTSTLDPRRVKVSVDPDSGTYASRVEVGDLQLGMGFREPLRRFAANSMQRTFETRWRERSRRDVNSLGALTPTTRQGLQLKLPVALPTPIQSLLGPGGPALNVSGAENIRISGTSNWTNATTGVLGQKRSLFPSLDMQQDLDIRLEGQLSDRVKVNLLQNSANQVPLANRIAINYRGDEDDLVQALDLGNTNLSLPGTQYVSYSGRNEGLFGVKLSTRVGPLDFTALASKQEGRSERASFSGGAGGGVKTYEVADYQYIHDQYFLLYDPNTRNPNSGLPSVYRIDDASIELYLDDAKNDNNQNTLLGRAVVDPDRVLQGSYYAGAAPDTAFRDGRFDKLVPGPTGDYEILPDYYLFNGYSFKVIRLKNQLTGDMCLAAKYRATPLDPAGNVTGPEITVGGGKVPNPESANPDSALTLLKMLRVPRALQRYVQQGTITVYDPAAPFEPVRQLEMKNFYSLGAFGIDAQTFDLKIQAGRLDPPVTYAKDGAGNVVYYTEVAGLDSYDESQSPPVKGHDLKVDGATGSGQRAFVDYKNGILYFPDPRPFAPRLAPSDSAYFDQVMDYNVNRRVRFDGPADSANAPNPLIYDRYGTLQPSDARYYLELEYAAQRSGGDIVLGKGSIIEGSEVVTVNGERWTRDRDYSIDYDIGRITLKKQLGPTDQLSVDYSYAPLFQQASKTLLGGAFRLEGRDRSLGGAFLYESKGAQDQRPRLGEEPSRTVITDLNSEWRFKPSFVTRFVDALPGVRTTTPSEFNVQAEVGASFPNPNTRNVVYLDDMEGVRDAVSLSLGIKNWQLTSPPKRATAVLDGVAVSTRSILADATAGQRNAELHWYQTSNGVVKESDLKPTLVDTDPTAARTEHATLALTVPKRPAGAAPTDTMWAGLTYPLDPVGIDLSRAQFIEVWVNDFRDQHKAAGDSVARIRGDHVKLHIDLGVVSEDQMRAPNRPPNNRLDSEDKGPTRDRQLVNDEDTGLDGVFDSGGESANGLAQADLTTANGTDWNGDDYGDVRSDYKDVDPRRFQFSNGTEGDKTLAQYPETEDLNLNDVLDTDEAYYEYTVALDGTSPYLVTDVWRDNDDAKLATDNGWRRYRIPIADSLRVQFGSPDLTIARHVRLWIEGLQKPDEQAVEGTNKNVVVRPLLMLGGLDIVGSRWLTTDLTLRQRDTLRTTVTLTSLSTTENADEYVAPFDPGQTVDVNQARTRREQSMVLEFENLAPEDTLEAYRTFSLQEDYSRYGALTWYATGFDIPNYTNAADDSLFYFVRFSTDETNQSYYEVKRKLPASTKGNVRWEGPRADLAAIANLKLAPDFPTTLPILFRTAFGTDGDSIIVKGRPSFTRLRRISFGVINGATGAGGRSYPRGQLWFDELRATDVAKDVGFANRLLVNGSLSNLMSYNVSWNSADANFLSVGQSRGTGNKTTNLAITTTTNVHRFFEGTGIQLPVTASYTKNTVRPRFTAGDDVVRTGVLQDLSTTETESRTFSTSYTRNWSQRSNPLLRYTLGGITANLGRTESNYRNPTGRGRTTGTTGAVNWNIAPRSLLALGAKWMPVKIYPLPERLYWNYQVSQTRSETQTLSQDGSGQLLPNATTGGRTAGVNFGADTRPVDMLRHHIEGTRALSLTGVRLDRLGFVNLGRLTQWRQSFDFSWSQQRGSPWLRPVTRWSSNYGQNNELQSEDLSVKAISNGQTASFNWSLPFDQLRGSVLPGAPANTPPRTATPPDSGAAPAPVAQPRRPASAILRDMLARLGQVQTDFTISRSSSYSRLSGSPSPLYLLGVAENPGFADSSGAGGRVAAESGNNAVTGLDWRANVRSQVSLAYRSSLSIRGSYGDRTTVSNAIVNRTRERRFPDLEVDYGKLADVMQLTRFLRSPALRTGWSWSRSWDYQGDRSVVTSQSSTHDLRPLLSLRGSLKNGTTADLGVNMRSSYREVTLVGKSTQRDKNTDVNFTLSRSYSQGQKVNLFGKTSTVRSSVNLSLATVYSRRQGETTIAGSSQLLNQVDETRLSVTGKGSYGFSTNVTGNAVLGYSGTSNHVLDIQRRSIRVELSAQFTF